jgi:hypothetical protein
MMSLRRPDRHLQTGDHDMLFINKTVRRRVELFLLVFFGATHLLLSQEFVFPPSENQIVDIPTSWEAIPQSEVIPLLKMLRNTSESTVSKINTISGTFAVEYQQGMWDDFVPEESGVVRHKDYTLQICVDRKQQKSFYAEQTSRDEYIAGGRVVTPDNVRIVDHRSIFTDEDCIYTPIPFSRTVATTIVELPGFPELTDEKLAWRVSPEWSFTDSFDPVEYYDFSNRWRITDHMIESLEGKHGEDQKNYTTGYMSLFQSTDAQGKKWIRYHQRFKSSEDPSKDREINVFWKEESEFHPVCRVSTSPSNVVFYILQVQWKLVDGLYYPVESQYVTYNDDGSVNNARKMKANDLAINKPIGKDQFSLSALGLVNGDYLVDRIDQKVFTIKKNKPVFLANFGEEYKYSPPVAHIPWYRWVMIGLGIVLILISLYMMLLRAREK